MLAKKIALLICASLWLSTHEARAVNVIFDLGNVLIEKKYSKIISEIGFWNFPLLSMQKARNEFFVFLDNIEERNTDTPLACDENGKVLPQIMCDWLTGTKSSEEIITLINTNQHLCSARYRTFIIALSELLFNPENAAPMAQIIPDGLNFVSRCIEAGHDVYILSNWDPESFPYIYEAFPSFFDQFKGIAISGNIGLIKPDPVLFQELMNAYNLDPHESVFIDDQLCNIEGAQKCGIYSIHCPQKGHLWWRKPDFRYVQEQLDAWISTHQFQEA